MQQTPGDSSAESPPPQAPRADARRNLERLVAAARDAVAELGMDVSPHEIARRAGVGVGTFYRRIDSRDALLQTILTELIVEGRVQADASLSDPDPRRAFARFAESYVELRIASRGVCEALDGRSAVGLDRPLDELRAAFQWAVLRAQRAGALRADVRWQDVPFLLAAVIPPESQVGLRAGDQQWQRNLQIVLDGLWTAEPSPLPGKPPRTS